MTDATEPDGVQDSIKPARDALSTIWEILNEQQLEIVDLRKRLSDTEKATERLYDIQEELQYVTEVAAEDKERVRLLTQENGALKEVIEFERREATRRRSVLTSEVDVGAALESTRIAHALPLGPLPEADPAPVDSAPLLEPLADAFRGWCHHGGALNGSLDLFAAFLRERLDGAHARIVHRDADSPARPVTLTEASSGSSAVVYWVVSHDGRHRLLPQPMGPHQFRELAPCFVGDAAPASLVEVEPGTVDLSPSGFVLAQPGRVS